MSTHSPAAVSMVSSPAGSLHAPRGAFAFDGSAFDYLVARILSFILMFFTLGLAMPWSICMMQRWRCTHTLYQGRRLRFTGSGLELFGNYIKWWFFTLITLGFYAFWLFPAIERWVAEHTEIA